MIGLPPVLNFGRPELQKRIVPEVLQAKKFICLAISEAFAGSDVNGMATRSLIFTKLIWSATQALGRQLRKRRMENIGLSTELKNGSQMVCLLTTSLLVVEQRYERNPSATPTTLTRLRMHTSCSWLSAVTALRQNRSRLRIQPLPVLRS